jgi:hypothetical protein
MKGKQKEPGTVFTLSRVRAKENVLLIQAWGWGLYQ